MKTLKTPFTVRGDCYYCPLSFSLDCYWNCLVDCHHCYFRRLNRTWGQELRPIDTEQAADQLDRGLRNKNPKSSLAHCLAAKKTIRVGNKTDPFQPVEREYQCSKRMIEALCSRKWSFVIQTRCTELMEQEVGPLLMEYASIAAVMPVVSPGWDKDWEFLERGRTTPPRQRLATLRRLTQGGVNGGVNGEPFIPGYHTVADFENVMKLLVEYGIPSYNTYNFHFNEYVAKRLVAIGVDIEAIWYYNQDDQWKKILAELILIAKKYQIKLGCPDFVNTGSGYREPSNTCCGIQVPNPTRFNTHWWKKLAQKGCSVDQIVEKTWDGVGEKERGRQIIVGEVDDLYTLKDAGFDLGEML